MYNSGTMSVQAFSIVIGFLYELIWSEVWPKASISIVLYEP